jgi:hypothetical protein
MDCSQIEERLSEYMEGSLASIERDKIAEHIAKCAHCSGLLNEMQSVLAACKNFPKLKIDSNLVESILIRTTGHGRTRTLREKFQAYSFRSMLTLRFAANAAIATLLIILSIKLMMPHITTVVSAASPAEALQAMDRGVQRLYSKGIRAYNKKNEWQDQLIYFKNNLLGRLGFMYEKITVPLEGKKKSEEPWKQQEKTPKDKNSLLLPPVEKAQNKSAMKGVPI